MCRPATLQLFIQIKLEKVVQYPIPLGKKHTSCCEYYMYTFSEPLIFCSTKLQLEINVLQHVNKGDYNSAHSYAPNIHYVQWNHANTDTCTVGTIIVLISEVSRVS